MVDRIDVEFFATDGTKLAAWLFRPANRSNIPSRCDDGAWV